MFDRRHNNQASTTTTVVTMTTKPTLPPWVPYFCITSNYDNQNNTNCQGYLPLVLSVTMTTKQTLLKPVGVLSFFIISNHGNLTNTTLAHFWCNLVVVTNTNNTEPFLFEQKQR